MAGPPDVGRGSLEPSIDFSRAPWMAGFAFGDRLGQQCAPGFAQPAGKSCRACLELRGPAGLGSVAAQALLRHHRNTPRLLCRVVILRAAEVGIAVQYIPDTAAQAQQ